MKNKIDDLRNHLFATLEALRDDEKPMDLDRARAVCQVADRIIDSARVECEFIEVTGTGRSDFMPNAPAIGSPERPKLGRMS